MKKQTLLYTILLIALIFLQNKSKLKTNDSEFFAIRNFISNSEYFPLDSSRVLFYKSNLGDIKLEIEKSDKIFVAELKSDDFIYRQNLIIREDGVYVKETYQNIKVFLIVNKESRFTYDKPLPRFKYPISPGQTWIWKGIEFNDEEKNKLEVKSTVVGTEMIKIRAGEFNTMKVVTEIESASGTKNRVTEWLAKDIGIIKSEIEIQGGGIIGIMRDILGYGVLSFELSEIKTK
ncbi:MULTISPECIES: hypothetical protein [Ignavibacterium]|jgi:hypothetical protein|uniref:TapB family protein n=1 Tax=Ignavibacterium TaxID=795750 RepID=UPI0025BF0161|nr:MULTISPECIES: hypothetical protein [Ignavibacterium]MBI5662260.1 hypothetical protein [Ignavibacterium album]